MTSTAKKDWPRAYLLQIHQEAVAHGLIFVEGITFADAKSLKQRLYRVRRRSDKSTATFILPEYHMVTVGEWQPASEATRHDPDGLGRLPIIYNRTPDGSPLPIIRPATPEEASAAFSIPEVYNEPLPIPTQEDLEHANITLKPEEVDNFVADLMKKAEKRGQ